jgi:hypothetical protein
MFPEVARLSPAITTPPAQVAATIVVACGICSPTGTASASARVGSRFGACAPRNSVKDEDPEYVKRLFVQAG